MFKFQKELQSGYFSDYSVTDLLFVISCIFMICAAVAYSVATSQSVPLPIRFVFFILFGISFFKIDFFLPLISSLLILDYFSVTSLGILPSDRKYIVYLIIIPLFFNFRYCFLNFYATKTFLLVASLFLLYTFLVTRLNGSMESDFIYLVMTFTLLLGFVSPSRTLSLLFWSFVLSSFLLSFQAFLLKDELIDMSFGSLGKIRWTDPNYMSLIIDFGILLSFYLFLVYKSIFKRVIIICLLLLQFYIMLLLGSRGGIIICFVSVLFLFRKDFLTAKFLYYAVGISVVLFIFYYNGLLETIIYRFQENSLDTAAGRTVIWSRILDNISQRNFFSLLFGTGSTSSWYVYSVVYALRSPHNNYLEFFFDYGFIGLSFFLGMIIYIFYNSKNVLSQAVIVFILLSGVALSPFNYEFSWLFLLFSIFIYQLKTIFPNEEEKG